MPEPLPAAPPGVKGFPLNETILRESILPLRQAVLAEQIEGLTRDSIRKRRADIDRRRAKTGFLLKDSAEVDLVPSVRTVEGKPFFSPAVTSALLEDYMRYLQQRNPQDSYELLTDREKVCPNTADTHRTNLMQKLGWHNTAEVVLYAVRKKMTK